MEYNNNDNIKQIIDNKEEPLTLEGASVILETVIDTLCEVGNGITDYDLHVACDQLLHFRDNWFNGIKT